MRVIMQFEAFISLDVYVVNKTVYWLKLYEWMSLSLSVMSAI